MRDVQRGVDGGRHHRRGHAGAGTPPARLLGSLPAGARLENESAPATAAEQRVLTFNQMSPDRECRYVVRGQVVRDGRATPVERAVTLRGGTVTQVSLAEPAAESTVSTK